MDEQKAKRHRDRSLYLSDQRNSKEIREYKSRISQLKRAIDNFKYRTRHVPGTKKNIEACNDRVDKWLEDIQIYEEMIQFRQRLWNNEKEAILCDYQLNINGVITE